MSNRDHNAAVKTLFKLAEKQGDQLSMDDIRKHLPGLPKDELDSYIHLITEMEIKITDASKK